MTDINIGLFLINAVMIVAVFILAFISSVLLHEMGHLIVLRKYSKRAKVYFHKVDGKLKIHAGKEEDYLGLSSDQLGKVYTGGIFLGLIPTALFMLVNLWGLALVIIYLIGCNSDFKKLKQLDEGN